MAKPKAHRSGRPKKVGPKPPGHLQNIEWLIAGRGAIHIGCVASIDCVASAADEHMCYAMLARRDGESLLALLARLDRSIGLASETSEPIDEINGP
jgi:hypothetical protein